MDKLFDTNTKIVDKAILVAVICSRSPKKYDKPLAELACLAETAGIEVLASITQTRQHIHPGSYVGSGKVLEIKNMAMEMDANLAIFDDDLSPGQARKLEKILEMRVVDRTELILDIFATHAQTREAKIQVELAQLEYALPRLKRMWEHLDRYEGGIGTRGPGEKQLETDKRLVKKRICDLGNSINKIHQRKMREVSARNYKFFTAGLIGYTNAGKSTLMNRLTDANVLVEDKLFATLDTRTRLWNIDGEKKVLLSDTVGFIDKLPHHLVASFKATLEEAAQSDILLHVADASHPDATSHIDTVHAVLKELGLEKKPMLLILNKIDLVDDYTELAFLKEKYPNHAMISAKQDWHILEFSHLIAQLLERNMLDLQVTLPLSNGKLISWMKEYARILNQDWRSSDVHYQIRLSQNNAAWLASQLNIPLTEIMLTQ